MEVPARNEPRNPNECTRDYNMEVPAHNNEPKYPNEGRFSKLYNNLQPIIWVLKVNGVTKKKKCVEHYFTGFTVSEEMGLVMTTTQLWSQLKTYKVSGRRLNEDDFKYTLKVKKFKPSWDIALFKVDGKLIDGGDGDFAQNGSLEQADRVMTIAHPSAFVGSFTVGSVCFPCIDINDADLPSNDEKNCQEFKYDPFIQKIRKYRMMGDIWNFNFFEENKDKEPFDFEKQLHPLVPIIQCNGLNCSDGSIGSPIFNIDGKIVGMVTKRIWSYDIGIHVNLLRHFIRVAENPSESDLKGKAGLKGEADLKGKVDLKGKGDMKEKAQNKRDQVKASKKQKRRK